MYRSGGDTYRIWFSLLVILICVFNCEGCSKPPRKITVCDVQGSGSRSEYQGTFVEVRGYVAADLADQEQLGFQIQSFCLDTGVLRGIWISLDEKVDWINIGDEIRIIGEVEEQDHETRIKTKIEYIEILSLGHQLQAPLILEDIFSLDPLSFSYENLEGELVILPEGLVLSVSDDGRDVLVCPLFFTSQKRLNQCVLGQPYYLSLPGIGDHPNHINIQAGDQISNIFGVLRQSAEGYYLQILDPAEIIVQSMVPSSTEEMPPDDLIFPSETASLEVSITSSDINTFTPQASKSPSPVPSPTWYPVKLLISEVLPNPDGTEPELEWIEIYNPQSYGIPLTGVKLSDAVSPGGKEGALRFPDGWYIESNEVLVIANSGVAFQAQFGYLPDFEMNNTTNKIPELLKYPGWAGNNILLNNSGDEVLLIDPWDEVIDQLAYGNSDWKDFYPPAPAPPQGSSLERYPAEIDRNRAEDWRVVKSISPGWLNRHPSTSTITQTIPPTIPYTETSSVTVIPTTAPPLPTTIGPSETLSSTDTQTPTSSSSPIPSDSPTTFLTPSETIPVSLTITDTPSLIDTITLTPSLINSLTHDPPLTGTPIPSITPVPSTITPSPEPILLVINEIHADPHPEFGDANGDGQVSHDDDEFIEFVNISSKSLDLSNWKVQDEIRDRFIFPAGTVLNAGCALVLFGGEVGIDNFGGSLIFSAGSLGLNNDGDTVVLLDLNDSLIVEYQYGSEGGKDQSLTRYPDLVGKLPLILHSEIQDAEGRLFSPGVRIDGSSFGECP